MTIPGINPNRITDTPPKGSCWVCDEPNIPVEDQLRIPALCSEECRGAWVRMMDIATPRDRCDSTANLGATGADAFCRLSAEHGGEHSDGDFSWSWDDSTGTGVISVHVAAKGLFA